MFLNRDSSMFGHVLARDGVVAAGCEHDVEHVKLEFGFYCLDVAEEWKI